MWSRRAQEYEQKINSGEIYQIAEVVRDLNKNTDMPVDQSYSERQLFEKAFERLLGEVTVVLGSTEEEAKEKLNKALGKKTEENLVT
jgi:CarD family transcriptional regulator